MFGLGLALVGLQAVQAQVTIDVEKLTCYQFLAGQVTDLRTLGIWLNGYVNGERGKTHIDPRSEGHISLVHYCEDHVDALVLDAARNVYGADKWLSGVHEHAEAPGNSWGFPFGVLLPSCRSSVINSEVRRSQPNVSCFQMEIVS